MIDTSIVNVLPFAEQQDEAVRIVVQGLLDGLAVDSLGEPVVVAPENVKFSVTMVDSGIIARDANEPELFGDGRLVHVGFVDESMSDCDCGIDHVQYVSVRRDGMLSPAMISGTFMELLFVPPYAQWDTGTPVDSGAFEIEL